MVLSLQMIKPGVDMSVDAARMSACATLFPESFNNGGDDLEEIAYDAVIRYFEDRGFGIFVDRDDRFRALHSYEVLDGA